MVEFRNVRGHIEVFKDGKFQFSADTESEARRDLAENYQNGKDFEEEEL